MSVVPRLPLIEPESATHPVVVRVFEEIQRELGFGIVPNVFRAMASHPGMLEANWMLFRAVVLKGTLPRVLKEMVGVVVSAANDSRYARLIHLHSLGMQGVTADVLGALAEGQLDAPGLPPTSVAVLRFARAAAERPTSITAEQIEALTQLGLSSDEVMEVIATIQLFTAVNLFTDLGDVPVDGT